MSYRDTAPAYQEYASDMLAFRPFKLLSLAGRGLLFTMRNETWASGPLPDDPAQLARILGLSADEISALLPSLIPDFFMRGDAMDGSEGTLVSADLEQYRVEQVTRRAARQAAAEKTNRDKAAAKTKAIAASKEEP